MLLEQKPSERSLLNFLASDPTVFADVYARPAKEFIVFREYELTVDDKVDFVIFTNRSRLEVIFIEVKGADFNFLNTDGSLNAKVSNATHQVKRRFGVTKDRYSVFKSDVIKNWRRVNEGARPYNAVVGEPLDIDPEKDVICSGVIIAGFETHEHQVSRDRNLLEQGHSPPIHYNTWQSFVRRLTRA